jgi:hypothetical protein
MRPPLLRLLFVRALSHDSLLMTWQGNVDYRHIYVNMTNIPIQGTSNSTCKPAMGLSARLPVRQLMPQATRLPLERQMVPESSTLNSMFLMSFPLSHRPSEARTAAIHSGFVR